MRGFLVIFRIPVDMSSGIETERAHVLVGKLTISNKLTENR